MLVISLGTHLPPVHVSSSSSQSPHMVPHAPAAQAQAPLALQVWPPVHSMHEEPHLPAAHSHIPLSLQVWPLGQGHEVPHAPAAQAQAPLALQVWPPVHSIHEEPHVPAAQAHIPPPLQVWPLGQGHEVPHLPAAQAQAPPALQVWPPVHSIHEEPQVPAGQDADMQRLSTQRSLDRHILGQLVVEPQLLVLLPHSSALHVGAVHASTQRLLSHLRPVPHPPQSIVPPQPSLTSPH
jgi:hypothetical protein